MDLSKKIDLIIVSGFLGAGKTTFINQMLTELARRQYGGPDTGKTVYVVNEFGQKGLDLNIMRKDLAVTREDDQLVSYELDNGCICCSLKAEFSQLIETIISKHDPDRIIFEPSGMFILSELFVALSGEAYTDKLRIVAMICLIDATNHATSKLIYRPLLRNQAQLSDCIVVSKIPDDHDMALEIISDIKLAYPCKEVIISSANSLTKDEWDLILTRRDRHVRSAARQATYSKWCMIR